MLPVLVTVLAVVLIAAFLILIQLQLLGVPPMPSNRRIRTAVLSLLGDLRDPGGSRAGRRELGETAVPRDSAASAQRLPGRVYELGSGWGGLSRRIAREYPDTEVVGVERSVVPYLFSRFLCALRGPSNLRFEFRDIRSPAFQTETRLDGSDGFRSPTVIVAYLSRQHMQSLAAMLPAGHDIRVISAAFSLPDRKPDREIQVQDMYRTPVYRYDL